MKPREIVLKAKGLAGETYMIKVFWYTSFFVVALASFVYARFPSELLAPLIERHLSRAPFKVIVSGASLSFPPGVYLSGVTVAHDSPAGIRALVKSVSVTARPSILAALTGEEGGSLTARILGGELFVNGQTYGGANKKIEVEFGLADIDPGLSSLWAKIPWGKLSGKLNGEGEISIINQNIFKSGGELKASLSEGVFKVGKILSSDQREVKLDESLFELKYKSGKATINRAEIHGDEVDVSLSGDIILSRQPEFSRLNLNISIKLSGKLKQKFGPLLAFFKKDNRGLTTIHIGGVANAPSMR